MCWPQRREGETARSRMRKRRGANSPAGAGADHAPPDAAPVPTNLPPKCSCLGWLRLEHVIHFLNHFVPLAETAHPDVGPERLVGGVHICLDEMIEEMDD